MPRKSISTNQSTSNSSSNPNTNTTNSNQSNSSTSASTSKPSSSVASTKGKRARVSDSSSNLQQSATTSHGHPSASTSTNNSTNNTIPSQDGKKKQKKETRKKVNLACVYCRRSHMTCDSSRPCQRCIKREIAHLCHDEPNPRSHPHGPVKPKATTTTKVAVPSKSSPSTNSSASPSKSQSISTTQDPYQDSETISNEEPAFMPGDHIGFHNPSRDDSLMRRNSSTSSSNGADSPFGRVSNGPYSSSSALGALRSSGNGSNSSSSSLPPSISLTAETSPVLANSYSFGQVSGMNSSSNNSISASAELAGLRASASGSTPLLSLGNLASGSNHQNPNSVVTSSTSAQNGINWFSSANSPGQFNTTPGGSGLGSASWLGLGGTTDRNGGELTSDAAGGSEFNILSDFLDSLDGASIFGQNPLGGNSNNDLGNSMGIGESLGDSNHNHNQNQNQNHQNHQQQQQGLESSNENSNFGSNDFGSKDNERIGNSMNSSSTTTTALTNKKELSSSSAPFPPGFSSKTEKFFLTAADQNDGTRDERLARVIQAKYDAGLLRPYNPIPGYARLQSWCQSHASASSRRRIMKPISVFRPAFRQAAQSLSNLDLIFEAEATERLLLDYDRVFSTQGVPACLWRRAGEIYQGNREFAELVGVPVEMLREGKLCIYELMTEESAVNYWEKYGAVSFDAGQKAVLTSCVLRSRNTSHSSKSGFSAANAVAAQLPRSQVVSANQSGTQTPHPLPINKNDVQNNNHNFTSSSPSKNGTKNDDGENNESSSSGNNGISSNDKGKSKERNGNETEMFKNPINGNTSSITTTSSSSSAILGKEKDSKKKRIPRGREREEEEEGVVQIECCFSFTIRRDKVRIPQLIVGNFLPSRLE